MAGLARVGIEGLRDLNRSLRQMGSDGPKALRLALNVVANELITKIQRDIPKRKGKAAGSIKAASTRTEVRIRFGGNRAPYYPWLDFGGRTGPRKSVVRPFYREGRYIYPTLRRERDGFSAALERALAGVAHDAGLDMD